MHDGGEDVIEIERGSDFLRNFQQRVEGVNLALGFQQVGVVQRDGGLFADGREEKQVVFVERRTVLFVDQLDDAQHFVRFAQRCADPGLISNSPPALRRSARPGSVGGIFDQFGTGLLRDFAEQSFGERDARIVFDSGIFADFLGEVELLRAGVREPQIAGAGAEDVANFSGDDGQEFAEFERGGESAAEIVERREAFQSGKLALGARFRWRRGW